MKHRKYILLICTLAIFLSILLVGKFQQLENGPDQITLPLFSSENFKCFQDLLNAKELRDSNRVPNYIGINSSDTFDFHRNCIKAFLLNRFKRDTTKMENRTIFKFELEDAREPDEATKDIIRMHRKIELDKIENLKKQANMSTSKRSKRYAQFSKPRLIKFETSDAKEPDTLTKEVIRQSRARELKSKNVQEARSNISAPKTTKKKASQRSVTRELNSKNVQEALSNTSAPKVAKKKGSQRSVAREQHSKNIQEARSIKSASQRPKKKSSIRKTRLRRSVHIQYPHLVTFQLKDARNSHIDLRENIANQIRDSNGKIALQNEASENQDNGYFYSYQVNPKISNPISVRQINHLMLNGECNANNNYCERYHSTAQKLYINKGLMAESAPIEPWLTGFRASPPVPIKIIPLNIYQLLPHEPKPVQETQPIVSQKLYNPYPSPATGVNQEYNSYTKIGKDIGQIHQPESILASAHHQSPNSKVEPSNPISESNRLRKWIPSQHYGKSAHHFAYTEIPLTKLNDYRDISQKQNLPIDAMQEFQELSTLIGKSPSDQIEGLAYLISKEIQQRSRLNVQDPKQNTSPILFHPEKQSRANEGNALVFHEIKQLIPSSMTAGLSPNYKKIVNVLESPVIKPSTANSHKKQHKSEYFFGYQVKDEQSRNHFGHTQRQDSDGVTRGQYHTLLPDGRIQNTIYHADETGFHADVSFENPKC